MIGQIPQMARLDYPGAKVLMRVPPEMPPKIAGYRIGACAKEPWTAGFIEQMPPGSVFYDCGANVGSYALLAAALGHTVVAIEPAFPNYEALCRNIMLNGFEDKITPLPVALGDQAGMVWFQYRDLKPGTALHIVGQPPGGKPVFGHRQQVMQMTLNALVLSGMLPQPHFIKLDVDGGESGVLAGMSDVLKAEGFCALLLEMQPAQEEGIKAKLAEFGLTQTARFDQRNGQPIGVAYGVFVKASAASSG